MRTPPRILLLGGLLLGLGASLASAQRTRGREGFWLSFGLGYGSARERCGTTTPPYGCNDTTVSGITGYLRLGKTLSRHLLLGGEFAAWYHDYTFGAESLTGIAAVLIYYPVASEGFFVKGGGGLSNYYFSPGGGSIRGTGLGLVGGVGYDFRIGRNYFAVTPTADVWYGRVGDLRTHGSLWATGWKQVILSVGVGVTFP
jgi:hypothetical protein